MSATRGRDANTPYVDTASREDEDTSHVPTGTTAASDVLRNVLDASGADLSAHAVYESEVLKALQLDRDPDHEFLASQPWVAQADHASIQHGIGM